MTTEDNSNLERLRIYEALDRVLSDRHDLLDLLFEAADPKHAVTLLSERFGLDELQSMAVLDMQFRRVTSRDRQRIADEVRQWRDSLRSADRGSLD